LKNKCPWDASKVVACAMPFVDKYVEFWEDAWMSKDLLLLV